MLQTWVDLLDVYTIYALAVSLQLLCRPSINYCIAFDHVRNSTAGVTHFKAGIAQACLVPVEQQSHTFSAHVHSVAGEGPTPAARAESDRHGSSSSIDQRICWRSRLSCKQGKASGQAAWNACGGRYQSCEYTKRLSLSTPSTV